MHLLPYKKDTVHIAAIVIVLSAITAGIILAITFGIQASNTMRISLAERSQTLASALGPEKIMQLSGTAHDEQSQVYTNLKVQLATIKQANPDARSIYIMGKTQNNELFFYVDSEHSNSPDYSSAGERYYNATPENYAIFTNNTALVEGPVRDEYGTFISGLAPITSDGRTIAVVGIDVGADTYWTNIILATLLPLLASSTVALIVIIFERIRRQNAGLLALRSELVSVASHELRTPITGIRWAAESLQKVSSDQTVLKIAQAILDSALHLQASTDDILELTHATNGRSLDIKKTDITNLIREIISTQALAAEQKNVRIDFDSTWPATFFINCDANQIKRAVHNVLSNAIKYSGNNALVTISYAWQNNMHNVTITDSGIGIPANEQSKVFKGFYRASNAVKSDIPGTGLGLYLVKTVIQRHGGHVRIISDGNEGTAVTLALPQKPRSK